MLFLYELLFFELYLAIHNSSTLREGRILPLYETLLFELYMVVDRSSTSWHGHSLPDSLLVGIVVEFRPGASRRWKEATRSYSTSPPSGNQVDGSPLDCHTETIAKLARLAPAENGKLMEYFIMVQSRALLPPGMLISP